MQPGLELDTLVAQAMGIQVLGIARCDGHEGWTVIGRADDPDFETARLQPCYLQECYCNDPDLLPGRYEIFGHDRICLGVVPFYSTDISAAWEVVGKLRMMFDLWRRHDDDGEYWYAEFRLSGFDEKDTTACARTAPLAICLAALKACGVEVTA